MTGRPLNLYSIRPISLHFITSITSEFDLLQIESLSRHLTTSFLRNGMQSGTWHISNVFQWYDNLIKRLRGRFFIITVILKWEGNEIVLFRKSSRTDKKYPITNSLWIRLKSDIKWRQCQHTTFLHNRVRAYLSLCQREIQLLLT